MDPMEMDVDVDFELTFDLIERLDESHLRYILINLYSECNRLNNMIEELKDLKHKKK